MTIMTSATQNTRENCVTRQFSVTMQVTKARHLEKKTEKMQNDWQMEKSQHAGFCLGWFDQIDQELEK